MNYKQGQRAALIKLGFLNKREVGQALGGATTGAILGGLFLPAEDYRNAMMIGGAIGGLGGLGRALRETSKREENKWHFKDFKPDFDSELYPTLATPAPPVAPPPPA